ncbi:MAG: imidazole glycerol phosphate synthase subunit HisH [Candidatus Margulisbacteria bacterium]|nr:imidazole glycerol phosphate synthase subunit HisH [Candidatus Margulisiibacteriota bacterium]
MIYIIDYEAGNIRSVARAFHFFKKEVTITSDLSKVKPKDLLVLPGVGSFGFAMKELQKKKMIDPIKDLITNKTPFLGICLGLQLLFDNSEESPGIEGLGILKGSVKKFKSDKLSIPQIGWNDIRIKKTEFKEFDKQYFYFVHSYYVDPADKKNVLAMTNYGIDYVSAVIKENLIATQFHPEKSSKIGLKFLEKVLQYFKVS